MVPDDPQSSSGDKSDPQPPTSESKPASDDVDDSINGRVAVKRSIDSSPVKDCSVVLEDVTKSPPRETYSCRWAAAIHQFLLKYSTQNDPKSGCQKQAYSLQ